MLKSALCERQSILQHIFVPSGKDSHLYVMRLKPSNLEMFKLLIDFTIRFKTNLNKLMYS